MTRIPVSRLIAQAMLAGTAPPVYAHELARFNYWLRREDQALALFRELRAAGDARSEIRAQLFGEILPILCAHELYDQIMQEAGDIQARLQQQAEAYLEFSSSPTANPSRVQKLRKKFVTDCASFYETLLATGRGEDAESVKALLTTTVPTARSYALLIQKAGRLELFKLAQAIGDEAMEELPEGRTRPVETALRNYTQKAGKIKLKR